MQSVRKYDMLLNTPKLFSGVHARKFLGFTLTMMGIETNPYKFQAVITMRNPTNVNEVQHLTGRLASLFCFLSSVYDKTFLFFVALKKNKIFEWTTQCDEAFTKIKNFLTLPIVLTHPREESSLLLYLLVINQVMSSIFVQEIDSVEKHVYFISKVFRGVNACYQKNDK